MAKYDSALINYEDTLKIRSKIFGYSDDQVAAFMRNIAHL